MKHTYLHHQNSEISGEHFLEKRRVFNMTQTPTAPKTIEITQKDLEGKLDSTITSKEAVDRLNDLINNHKKNAKEIRKRIIAGLEDPMSSSEKNDKDLKFSKDEISNLITFIKDYLNSQVPAKGEKVAKKDKGKDKDKDNDNYNYKGKKLDISKINTKNYKDEYKSIKEKYNNKEKKSENNWRQINVRIAKEMGISLKGKSEEDIRAFGRVFQEAIGHNERDGKIGPKTLTTFLNMKTVEKAKVKAKVEKINKEEGAKALTQALTQAGAQAVAEGGAQAATAGAQAIQATTAGVTQAGQEILKNVKNNKNKKSSEQGVEGAQVGAEGAQVAQVAQEILKNLQNKKPYEQARNKAPALQLNTKQEETIKALNMNPEFRKFSKDIPWKKGDFGSVYFIGESGNKLEISSTGTIQIQKKRDTEYKDISVEKLLEAFSKEK